MLRRNHKTLMGILNSSSFKTMLFVFVLATVVKLWMNLTGRVEWYSGWMQKLFTQGQTTALYYGILAVTLLLYFVTLRESKKWRHILVMALIPLGVYVGFLRYQVKWVCYTAGVMFIALSALEIWFLWDFSRIDMMLAKTALEKKQIRKNLMKDWGWSATKTAGGVILYSMVLTLYAAGLSGATGDRSMQEPVAYASNVRDLQSTTPTNLWEPNKESLKLLAEDVYCTLDNQARLDALQELVNIECEYLGVEPCQLIMEDLSETSMGGYYRDRDRIISIAQEYVEKDTSLYGMHILLHEVYHSYQHECVRMFQALKESGAQIDMSLKYFRDCASWEEDFENYYAGDDSKDFVENFSDYYQYAAQSVETSANEYRDTWLGTYWEYVNDIDKDEKTPEEVIREVN